MNLMKTDLLNKALFLLLAGVVALNFTACSDEDDNNGNNPDNPYAVMFDQKEFLQNSLVWVDEAGNFKLRIFGKPLDADTTVLYVGADDLAEAKTLFKGLFAPGSAFSENGDRISCTLEKNGGTVTFAPASGGNGALADVAFSGCNLIAVSSLHFIEKSVWPDNDDCTSPLELGQKVWRSSSDRKVDSWTCVQESGYGQLGCLYRISDPVSKDDVAWVQKPVNLPTIEWVFHYEFSCSGVWFNGVYYEHNRGKVFPTIPQAGIKAPVVETEYFDKDYGSSDDYDPFMFVDPGDLYMKDGTIMYGGESGSITDDCIGIVYSIGNPTKYDEELKKDYPDCTHGLVVALHNAVGGKNASSIEEMTWSTNNLDLGAMSTASGYGNTKILRRFNSVRKPVYPVDAIDNYEDNFEQKAPSCTSGWYFPAVDELRFLYDMKGEVEERLRELGKNGLGTDCYWSSSELDDIGIWAWYVNFYDGSLNQYGDKVRNSYRVRPILAF